MNIGFNIARMNYLGHLGSLIDYFMEKNANVFLLCDYRKEGGGYKSYLYPEVDCVKNTFNTSETLAFHSTEEFVEVIIRHKLQVVFFIAFDSIAQESIKLMGSSRKVIFAHLQSGGDLMYNRHISSADVVYIFSEDWKQWWKKGLLHFNIVSESQKEKIFEQIDSKPVISGFPQADHMAHYDRGVIFEKYGIPEDKKVVLLLPFPWRVKFGVWSHIIYKPQNIILKLLKLVFNRRLDSIDKLFTSANDLQVAEAIRKFSQKNNAFFIVKGRLKNKVPRYLQGLAERTIFDETYYPYTIMELMFVADLSLCFFSDAIKESVIAGTPCICLGPTTREDWAHYAKRFFLKDFSYTPGNYYNFDGVVYNESVDDFAAEFPNKTFDDYPLDEKSRDSFIKKFLGFSDLRSSERIYNDISKRIKEIL